MSTASLSRLRFAPLGADRTSRRAGAIVAIALHVGAAVALLSYEPARTALLAVAPIMIDLITPPPPPEPPPAARLELPQPKPVAKPVAKVVQPPKPVVQPKAIAEPPPILAAPSEAPAVVIAAPPAPPGPTIGSAQPADAASGGSAAAVGGSGAGVSITPPIFNAGYLENPSPAYPPVSRRMREQGRVMLRVLVNTRGTADEVQVRTSSGISRLDEAAVETVKRWKFVPAKRGNDAVSAWVLIPISFTLEG